MCRVLAYLGEPVLLDELLYAPDNSLVRQSYAPQRLRMLNLAGFGVAAWDPESRGPREPYTYHTQGLPVFDGNLRTLARKVRPNCVLAHVRGVRFSDSSSVGPQFLHPFLYPGMSAALAHNGDLHGFDAMRPKLQRHLRPEISALVRTSLDSEWIYALFLSRLLSRLREPEHGAEELADSLVETLEILGQVRREAGIDVVSSANLFVADGRAIVAARYAFDFGCYPEDDPAAIGQLDYLSLWYSLGSRYACHEGEWKMLGGQESASAMLLASEPLTRDESTWLEVPEYSLVAFDTRGESPRVSARMIEF